MKQLTLNEINIGMRVFPRQLDEILYTYIILANKADNNDESEIIYIGDENIEKFKELKEKYPSLCVVYNTEEDLLEV